MGAIAEAQPIEAVERAIEAEFDALCEFSARAAHLVALGRALERLPAEACCEDNRVAGCQSLVWVVARADPETRRLRVAADSDSALMRGLLALVLRLYDDRPPAEVLAHEPAVIDRLLTGRSLAPSRANGLHLVVRRVRAAARDHLASGAAP
ncbi:SufE family protein [Salinarimonas rosea]|uniref:SufE family protein n=1 Tax=Salinarimonas rosea TaxID=552063 RepID=UPI0004032F3F|nr:SufE family protein [Salinarimonas rosea]